MAPKRKSVPTDRIVTLMTVGKKADQITEILNAEGYDVSRPTVTRRMAEVKGQVNAARATAPCPSPLSPVSPAPPSGNLDEIPDEIPDGTPIGDVNKWIAMADNAADKVFGLGDYNTFTTLLGKLATLKEHQRKAMPPPKSDPNDDLDLRKLGAEVAKRLHRLAKEAAG